MSLVTLAALVGGLALLIAGAELLVRGASRLAVAAGVSPLVVGLTVVAFGTSAPEAAVTTQAAVDGRTALAVGSVIGSNIFNVLVILGLSAAIAPLVVHQRLVRFDVPLMIAVSLLAFGLAANGRIGRWEGALLVSVIVVYTVFVVWQARRARADVQAEYAREFRGRPPGALALAREAALVVAGLILLVAGSRVLVGAATELARWFGVSELVIGLTVVAAGTSLPEAAASVVAALRGARDIAVGNVVGSNLFNLTAALGLAAVVSDEGLPVSAHVLQLDMVVMLMVAVACLPIAFTGHRISRWEGWLFLGYYFAYTAYLILAAREDTRLQVFTDVMVIFVIPLTAVTLGVLAWRAWIAQRRPGV
jgi:cation:H+ antiporter